MKIENNEIYKKKCKEKRQTKKKKKDTDRTDIVK